MNRTPHRDGHVTTQDELDRDRATVLTIYAQMPAIEPRNAYGPVVGSPDDAKQARIDREDDEALWAARLAAGPDVAQEDA